MSHATAALAGGSIPASDSQANGDRASDAPPAVRVRGVRRSFEAELAPVRALRGLDLDVAAGEFAALMGPSGCGKSTVLNIVAGLDRPDEGSVEVAASGSAAATRSGWRGSAGITSAWSSSSSACWMASACWTTGPARHPRRPAAPGGRRPRPRTARPAGHRRARRPPAGRAVGRAAPAAGDRPGTGQRPGSAAGRRADRRPGQRGRAGCAGAAAAAARGRADDHHGDAAPEVAAGAERIVRMRDGRAEAQP